MNKSAFLNIKIFNNDKKVKGLKLFDMFLVGENMKNQKDKKKVGDQISYYVVTEVKNDGHIIYEPKYDVLED